MERSPHRRRSKQLHSCVAARTELNSGDETRSLDAPLGKSAFAWYIPVLYWVVFIPAALVCVIWTPHPELLPYLQVPPEALYAGAAGAGAVGSGRWRARLRR